jgi:hypothetical protein
MTTTPLPQVLALVDDAALARRVLEMSSAIARQLHRPLEVVYVESAPALLAASLPFAQVLAHGGAQWLPLVPQDVERGYRVQEARLRELAERITLRHTIHWTMRVIRGVLPEAAVELRAQSDLMFVDSAAGTPSTAPYGRSRTQARGRPAITAVVDGSAAGQQAQRVAQQVAQALGGVLNLRRAEAGTLAAVAGASRCDLLVLPSALAGAGVLAKLSQPALLVG